MTLILLFALFSIAHAIFITCDFNYNNWITNGNFYNCDVKSIDFSDNQTHITGFNGSHLNSNSCLDVKIINFGYPNATSCSSLNLTVFPKGFINFFPNIIGFIFWECAINSLNGDELNEYSNIRYYIHHNSNLTRIPGEFFASNPGMKYVFFSYNKLMHVGENLLDNLQNLETVWFLGNTCVNKGASNPSEIPALIEVLRQNCTDIELETTTSQLTTTNAPPRCEINDVEDFVCGLDEEIQILQNQIKELKTEKEALQRELQMHNDALLSHGDWLLYLDTAVNELKSRPCEC